MLPEKREGQERLDGLDALRALAIVFVVMVHAAAPLERGYFYRDQVVGGIARLGVPIFILLSGILAGFRQTPRERFRSYLGKFIRLHVIYGLLYGVLTWLRSDPAPDVSLKWIVLRFGGAGWAGQYYLLIVIQLYFIAAFVVPRQLWTKAWFVPACALLTPIGMVLPRFLFSEAGEDILPGPLRALVGSKLVLWSWLYYFALGTWLGTRMRREPTREPAGGRALGLMALALLVSLLGIPLPLDADDPNEWAYLRPRIYVATTLVALAVPALASLSYPSWWLRLGRDTFGIYVSNPAILLAFFTFLVRPEEPLTSLALVVATVALAAPFSRWLRRHAGWAYA